MSSFTALSTIPTNNTPEEFIQELIKMKANPRIYDFMLELKDRFFPKINMILYEDLSQYVGREKEFCVDARMFYKYSKLFVDGYDFDLATADPKSNIKDVLKSSKMKIDSDYLLLIVQEQSETSRGIKHANRYMMTPDSFYLLLMDIPDRYRQARQTFCKYHAFMTKVIKYYDNFQLELAKLIDEERQQMLATKDTKIDDLMTEIKKQSEEAKARDDDQTAKINQLLQTANKLVGQNDKLQFTVDMTREELSESLDYLVDKSYHSTIDPTDESNITHFAVLAPTPESGSHRTILVRGQLEHIFKKIDEHRNTHIPLNANANYNANSINLIINAQDEYDTQVRSYLRKYNQPIIKHNNKLQSEIIAYNAKIAKHNRRYLDDQKPKRMFANEKKPLLTLKDIPIKFKRTYISYWDNEHFSYDEVIQFIWDTNKKTQKSPAESK